jgi:N6-adenosine-specific RNA methylase IME4
MDLPKGKFDVLLIDPPWSYHGQQNKWGAAAKFYKTMSDKDLQAMPIKSLLNRKAVVFIWATGPRLDAAIKLIDAWGLHYRGVAFTWVKTKKDGITPIGARGVRPSIVKPTAEFVLAASTIAKGRPLSIADESVKHIVLAATQEHSRKPDEVHESINRLYPKATKLELFARRQYAGWEVWGNEV